MAHRCLLWKKQVLEYKSPLYGRRTAQFKLKPFNLKEAQAYFKLNEERRSICFKYY